MKTRPEVSIIIPVYNAERYLRECLDSVVNQTLREIQIICVNDGSTDGSSVILEEYAARDPRITIIHQENQGAGAARNSAYPHIRGKYTYFVDSDDWIDLDLCQQCRDKAEETMADFVMMQFVRHGTGRCVPAFDSSLPDIRRTPDEKHEIFDFAGTCYRFWKSDFFLFNHIRFTEGKQHPADDFLPTWKGTALAERIAILDSPLYHYRNRPDSLSNTVSERLFLIVDVFETIGKMLHEVKLFETYRDSFIKIKWDNICNIYHWLPWTLQYRFLRHMRKYVREADREFFRDHSFCTKPDKKTRSFFLSLVDGGWPGFWTYSFRNIVLKWPERITRRYVTKPLKTLISAFR